MGLFMKLNIKKFVSVAILSTLFLCSCSTSQSQLKERFDLEKYKVVKNIDVNTFYTNEKYSYFYNFYSLSDKEAYFPLQTLPTINEKLLPYKENACLTSLYFRDQAPTYMVDHGYNYYPCWFFENQRIIFCPTISENECKVMFKNTYPSSVVSLQNQISVIENNGIYGYQMNILDQDYLNAVLSILYNCVEIPYDIYVVDGPATAGLYADVYFIPQDKQFSKDIVDEFLKIDTCFYFDKNALKNYN